MSLQLAEFTEKLIPVSDFSQGKAGKVFRDVAENGSEYIVLRNNQPTAVVMSVKEYKDTQVKLDLYERLLEKIEDMRLLGIAKERKDDESSDFEDFVKRSGFSMTELEEMSESVNIE